jgi:iron(III) transport system ATP-binding protein
LALLEVRDLVKTYPGARQERHKRVLAVDHVSLDVQEGELYTLLGPSGCGKTTTLRSIAGLETPDEGTISLGGRVLFSSQTKTRVPANQRGLGMVFQSYAIWPHMNVFDNVAFPLQVLPRGRRPARPQLRERVERVLAVVKLDQLAAREATALSGGQQQRLALARALVMEPALLLLDEPLSNLDAKLREEMRFELKRLQRELGITCVYVTHDQTEALAMSNEVAVMRDGRVEQVGRPREIYESPKTRFVADFIGTSNFIEGVVEEKRPGGYLIRTPHGRLEVRSEGHHVPGDAVVVSARPEHISLSTETNGAGPNRWPGRVAVRSFLGEVVDHVVEVETGESEIRVRCNSTISIPPETEVTLVFNQEAFTLIPAGE